MLFSLHSLYTVQGHKPSKSVSSSINRHFSPKGLSIRPTLLIYTNMCHDDGPMTRKLHNLTKTGNYKNITYRNKMYETVSPPRYTYLCPVVAHSTFSTSQCSRLHNVIKKPSIPDATKVCGLTTVGI